MTVLKCAHTHASGDTMERLGFLEVDAHASGDTIERLGFLEVD